MHLKKLIASLTASICLIASLNVAAYADTAVPFADDEISLAYEIAEYPISSLTISGNTATCTSSVESTTAVSITVTQTLQKHKGLWIWDDVDGAEWVKTVNRNSIYLSNSKSGLTRGKYRVKSVFILTAQNGKSEKFRVYSDEQNVP